ncbi:DinB family protein [Humisphaera borealis]|uniref:DinB family protein n=1 Tax=Humisphaera borealis TaxID=2807512 RepID=A0A7M2WQP7_9BACT|nr:DinB family protein [Humisphaera borealis]QOV87796.1 DinB family protein [Humisphaera borealis]
MPTSIDVLVNTLTGAKGLVMGYCQDLGPAEYLHRPTPESNCVAWLLGHLVLTDRRIMTMVLGASDLPALPDGFEKRFSRDAGCPQASDFGDTSILLPLFAQTRDLLIARVRSTDPADFDKPLAFKHPRFDTPWGAVNFMGLHAAMHAGQITIIRRSLGRPPLV